MRTSKSAGTMNEAVLSHALKWRNATVKAAEYVDVDEFDLSSLPSAYRMETHGKELICVIAEQCSRGVSLVLYNVIGDTISDAELQDMANENSRYQRMNPGSNEE